MNKIYYFKSNFVRQDTEDGCGAACLAMLLYQQGRIADAEKIQRQNIPKGGLSLLQLHKSAVSLGFDCRCVEMDLDFLKTITGPVILHTKNDNGTYHFQVCYSYTKSFRKSGFLMADPATQVYYLDEVSLDRQWVSRAALYFDEPVQLGKCKPGSALFKLLDHRSFPPGLIFALPVLNVMIAVFGVTLTWLLQKGLSDISLFNNHIIYVIVGILFFISIARNLISYLRQYILIRISLYTNSEIMKQLYKKIFRLSQTQNEDLNLMVSNNFLDLQKIQNAISAFVAIVISDGCFVVILLAGSGYLMWLPVFINFVYILLMVIAGVMTIPGQQYGALRIRALSRISEYKFLNLIKEKQQGVQDSDQGLSFMLFYNNSLEFAKALALKACRNTMVLEFLGSFDLTIVLIIGIYRFHSSEIDYASLMLLVIETYLITILMQRIIASFQQIAEGADAALAHSRS